MACNPEVLKHVPLFALLDDDETEVLASQVELKNFRPAPAHLQNGRPGRPSLRDGFRDGSGHHRRPGSSGGRRRRAAARRVLWLCLHAGTDAAPDDRHRARRNRLPRSRPQRYLGPAATEAAGGHGHADRPRPPVPRIAATRPRSRHAQSQRRNRCEATFGERIADTVAGFGGSWTFIIIFCVVLWSSTAWST